MLNSAGLLCLQGQRVCVAGLGGTAHWIWQRRADPGCCRWPVGLPEVARLLATQAPPLAVTCQTRARSSAGTRSTSELGGRFTPPHRPASIVFRLRGWGSLSDESRSARGAFRARLRCRPPCGVGPPGCAFRLVPCCGVTGGQTRTAGRRSKSREERGEASL